MAQLGTCLWFDDQGEDAANFYVKIFKNSKITGVSRYTDVGKEIHGQPAGKVMTVRFELDGAPFMALNGGPQFKFSEAISLVVNCDSKEEVDEYWEKLTADGGEEGPCGWLKDKFGVSWQVVPKLLEDLLADPDKEKAGRVMAVMLQMHKIDTVALQQAYDG